MPRCAGIARERIGDRSRLRLRQDAEHNLELLRRLRELAALGVPVLAGWSRKSMLGAITGRPASERLAASVAAALLAVAAWRDNPARARCAARRATRWRCVQAVEEGMSRKYFGTDGVRGTVGRSPITPDFVMRLGYAAGA